MAEITIKRPSKFVGAGKRSTFALVRKVPGQPSKTLNLPELAALNRAFQSGELDLDRANLQVAAIKKRLLAEEKGAAPALVFHSDNLKILVQYWKKWRPGRQIVDDKTSFNELRRAVEALGTLNLRTATFDELRGSIKATGSKQARIVKCLNRLLKFIGRGDIKIPTHKPDRVVVRYLTLEDFQRVLALLPDSWFKYLCGAAFACGGRAGELFALTADDWDREGGQIFLERQLDTKLVVRGTKNRRPRYAVVIPQFESYLESWIALPSNLKRTLRSKTAEKLSGMFRAACIKADVTPLTFHDIRHCYARHVLKKDPSLSRVADYLGDDEATAKKHYLGFIRDKDEIALTRKRLAE